MKKIFTEALGVGLLLTGVLPGCAENGNSPAPDTAAYAKCNSLSVTTNPNDHTVSITPNFSVAHGARYAGTTYILDPRKNGVTVKPAEDPTGHIAHHYPAPAQKREIRAVINYQNPDNGKFYGALGTCAVKVIA